MNNIDTQKRVLQILSESKLAIINFQEELLELNESLNLINEEEKKIIVSMLEDINYIVGTIVINCFHLEILLKGLENDASYYAKNIVEINNLLNRVETFNSQYLKK
jgi:hypothetical protein